MRGIVALGLIAILAGTAVGDPNPDVAKRLFAEGRVLYDQGKYIEACVLFEKSYQLDPAVGTKLNLAECAERDQKPRAAWLLWISAADEFDRDNDNRAKFARGRADALAAKLATVIVKIAKPKQTGITVEIAGREVAPSAEIIDRLDPGAINVVVRAPGRETFETTVTVALGGKVTVEVPRLAKLGGEAEPSTPKEARNPWWIATISTGVITAVAAGLYVYSYSQIKRVEDELDVATRRMPPDVLAVMKLNAEGFTWETRTRVGLGIMIGGAVVTTALILKARSVDRQRASTTASLFQLSPVIAPRVVGAQLDLAW